MSQLSSRDSLRQARAKIEAARDARGDDCTVVKHYRTAKKALAKVDVSKTDPPTETLENIIAAFQDLARVLDRSGEQFRGKAAKCRERASALRLRRNESKRIYAAVIAPSLIGPGFSQELAQAGVTSLALSNNSNSTAAPSQATHPTSGITLASRQLALPSPPAGILVSASIVALASTPFFNKDVLPTPYICPLPGPDEPLQTTRQLAYCLALLQPSVQDNILSDALQWRLDTLQNLNEKDRLETMAVQILQTFAQDTMKDVAAVAEVVQLAPVLNNNHSRFLFKTFIDTVNQSEILHLHSVVGLASAIQGAAPGSLDSDDFVVILRCLHKRLRSIHSASHHYHHLLIAVSRVLDSMADANIGDVDRINLHGPLTDFLRESESSEDPYLTFQASYATQALLNVSDDDNIWRAGFRRVWLVLKGGSGFAKTPDLTEIKDALEGLEKLYEVGEGGIRLFKEALEAVKDGEIPTFTVKDGLKFKRAWYRALRTAESYLQAGRLAQFKDLVTKAPCRHQLMFQWGICQLLGQFAADSRWDLRPRQDAIAFIEALYKNTKIWNRQKKVDQVIFDVLTNMVSNSDPHFEAAKSLLEEVRKRNTALKLRSYPQSKAWSAIRIDNLAGQGTPGNTLLDAVQNRIRRRTKLQNLPDIPPQLSLNGIRTALKTYHAPDLVILRVSGEELDLGTCFVNLAIVLAPEYREMEKQDLKDQAAIFHRIPSIERVKNANTQPLIPLEERRTLRQAQAA